MVVEVVAKVTVAVAAAVPVIVAVAGAQVGAETAPDGPVTAQVRLTAPVNPPKGVTVMVASTEVPGLAMVSVAGPFTPIFGVGTPVTVMPTPFDTEEA